MTFSILSIIDIQQNLYGCFAAYKPIFSKDDKNIEKNTETFLLLLFLLWQCCDLFMNISYQCLEFITAESHLINFLWIIKHWRKLMKLHEICHQSLQMGGVNILLDLVDNSVIDRMGAVSGGVWGSELHQVNMGGWENFFVVTEKWDRRQCKDWKKKTLASEGDVPSMNELCVIFIIWSFFLENAHDY